MRKVVPLGPLIIINLEDDIKLLLLRQLSDPVFEGRANYLLVLKILAGHLHCQLANIKGDVSVARLTSLTPHGPVGVAHIYMGLHFLLREWYISGCIVLT